MIQSLGRTLAVLAVTALIAGACGGASIATPATPAVPAAAAPASAAPGAAADPCGVPVKGKCPKEATALTAAGATFPAPIYTKWIDEYDKLTGVQINYQAVGSGGGIKSLTDKTVDYGASDVPLTDAQIDALKVPVLHIPTVMGSIVPTYNIPGVTASLKLTADALAGIYLEQIKRWNDPKIAAANPGVSLPDLAITTVHRSDGSGTTGVFTDYLTKVSADWKSKVGSGTSVSWPGGVGGSGNAGVAGAVKSTPGAVGYVELIYAIQNKITYGSVQNKAGRYVEANLDSTTAAADGFTMPDLASLKGQQAKISITNADNPKATPIATFTYIVTTADIADRAKALAIVRYLWWSTHEGQAFAKDLGYAPLPAGVVAKAEAAIRAISSGGQPVLPR